MVTATGLNDRLTGLHPLEGSLDQYGRLIPFNRPKLNPLCKRDIRPVCVRGEGKNRDKIAVCYLTGTNIKEIKDEIWQLPMGAFIQPDETYKVHSFGRPPIIVRNRQEAISLMDSLIDDQGNYIGDCPF